MDVLHAAILGLVQGLTEFLPISSTGHLILLPEIVGWETQPLVFDTIVHLGTACALIAFFFKELWLIGTSFLSDVFTHEDNFGKYSKKGRIGYFILLGSVPAGVLGFFLEDIIESGLRNPVYVAVFLLLGSVAMFIGDRVGGSTSGKIANVSPIKSFFVGLFQALALFPGVSRSGITITGGMLFGLGRKEATKFSFFLSVPIVVGAALYKMYKSKGYIIETPFAVTSVGFLFSFLSGMFAIYLLLGIIKKYGFKYFIVYRVVLAAIVLILTYFGI